jgi:hypothetical protein
MNGKITAMRSPRITSPIFISVERAFRRTMRRRFDFFIKPLRRDKPAPASSSDICIPPDVSLRKIWQSLIAGSLQRPIRGTLAVLLRSLESQLSESQIAQAENARKPNAEAESELTVRALQP